MLSVSRHGITLNFDDSGFRTTPWVYMPLAVGTVYEAKFLEHIRAMSRTGQYIDVGAHLGTHTVWFAMLCPSTHVHAFEPVRRYADVLRRNVKANDLEHKVTVHEVGLSDRSGVASNYLSSEHQVGISDNAEGVVEHFPVRRLDRVVRGQVAVIKIDVEGMEEAVLRGATRILSRDRPLIYAEAHSSAQANALRALLAPFGYRATGRVFNASPTYEFAAPPRRGRERLRPVWRRTPEPIRQIARRLLSRGRRPAAVVR